MIQYEKVPPGVSSSTEEKPAYIRTESVYSKIARVAKELSVTGIAKNHRNTQQNFVFRGIDDVFQTLSPILSDVGLVIIPRHLGRTVEEHTTKNGGTMFYVCLEVEFDLISTDNDSKCTGRFFGEAMDSGDKACGKAASMAYKNFVFQTFCVPTEGTPDADEATPEIEPGTRSERRTTPTEEGYVQEIPKHSPTMDWRDIICHVGKDIKGKPLRSIKPSELNYLITEWSPKKTVKGYRAEDAALRSALDAAMEDVNDNIP